ncbi:hypothetical protein [Nostoc sp. CCY 9925]|uniref:hypothetical protein n=1 Tax=Nostoc sp. CCY 9925 TaxID=3103865 RepID=UPI0039C6D856
MARTNRTRTQREGSDFTARKSRLSRFRQLGWNARYGDIKKYKKKVAIAHKQHRQAHSKCCCCLRAEATQMHHTEYTKNDKFGINWFPLCEKCHHEVAHSPNNWIKSRTNPVWGNRNTEEYIKRLQLGFELLYGGIVW